RLRLDGTGERAGLAPGHGVEHADVQSVGQSAGELGRAQHARGTGVSDVGIDAAQLRGAADAPRVEQAAAAGVDVAARGAEVEDARAFEEEGAALLEELLESREVEHGRIGLDLAEVWVERRIHREVAGDAP